MDRTISLHACTIPHNSQQSFKSPVQPEQQQKLAETKTEEIVTQQNVQPNTKIGFSKARSHSFPERWCQWFCMV
jgi:hypothetical protein